MVSVGSNSQNPRQITVCVGDTFDLPGGTAISVKGGPDGDGVFFVKSPTTVSILEWEGGPDGPDSDSEEDDLGDPVLDHPACRIVYGLEDLQKDLADHKAGLTGGRPWREVKAEADALYGRASCKT